MSHGSRGLWVTQVIDYMGHGSRKSRVTWVMDHVGHESPKSWVTWVMGHAGHGSRSSQVTWITCVIGHIGHGSRGSWVTWVTGHEGHRSHGSWVRWVKIFKPALLHEVDQSHVDNWLVRCRRLQFRNHRSKRWSLAITHTPYDVWTQNKYWSYLVYWKVDVLDRYRLNWWCAFWG